MQNQKKKKQIFKNKINKPESQVIIFIRLITIILLNKWWCIAQSGWTEMPLSFSVYYKYNITHGFIFFGIFDSVDRELLISAAAEPLPLT